jgi:monodehydroascorbate reductase (NADH)
MSIEPWWVQVIIPEQHVMPRLFTAGIAKRYEELYEKNGVKFAKV